MSTLPVEKNSADEFNLFLLLIQRAFTDGYAQGQFDRSGGFNTYIELEVVAKEWMDDHLEIFSVPVNFEKVFDQLGVDANEHRILTSLF